MGSAARSNPGFLTRALPTPSLGCFPDTHTRTSAKAMIILHCDVFFPLKGPLCQTRSFLKVLS